MDIGDGDVCGLEGGVCGGDEGDGEGWPGAGYHSISLSVLVCARVVTLWA